jgi:hypothetical protein
VSTADHRGEEPGAAVSTAAPAAAQPADRPEQSTGQGDAPHGRAGGPRWVSWACLAGVVVLGLVLVGSFVRAYEPLSPLDEMQHIDYVNHLLRGDTVELGDTLEPETQQAVACRGVDMEYLPPPCEGPYRVQDFPNAGYNTAYIHSPLYYGITAAWFTAVDAVGHPGDRVSAMRSSGFLWVTLGVLAGWALFSALRLPVVLRVAGCLLFLSSPTVVLAFGTVTNDATAIPVGAAVAWAVVRWDQGRSGVWLPALLSVVGVLLKTTNVGVVGMAVLFVCFRAWQRRSDAGTAPRAVIRRSAVFVAVVAGASAVVALGWAAVAASTATISASEVPQNAGVVVPSLEPETLFQALPTFVLPLEPAFPEPLRGPVLESVGSLVSVGLLVLFVLGARSRAPQIAALAFGTGGALLALGPLLTVVNYVAAGIAIDIPTRYGLSLVPAAVAVGLAGATGPRGRWVLTGLVGGCALLVARRLLLA